MTAEANYLPAAFTGDDGCDVLPDLVPGFAIVGGVYLANRSHAGVVEFDAWRFRCGRYRWGRHLAPAEDFPRPLRKRRSAFALIQFDRLLGGGPGPGHVACGPNTVASVKHASP